MNNFTVVDAHLDLAYYALYWGRNFDLSLELQRQQPGRESDQAVVSFSEMRQGQVVLVFATLYAHKANAHVGVAGLPAEPSPGYTTPEEAEAQALEQYALYRQWELEGKLRIITNRVSLGHHLKRWEHDQTLGIVLLMEGADPIVAVDRLEDWWQRGLRMIGTSWGRTRYAGGTGSPGGLTPLGRELISEMQQRGMILDASHMAEEAFWEALEMGTTRVMASHSNARALVNTDRQLNDPMLKAIAGLGGVVGLNLFNGFLDARWLAQPNTTVTLEAQVRAHLEHIAGQTGWEHVGIGSDIEGVVGLRAIPKELNSIADFSKIASVVPPAHQAQVLGKNWLGFLARNLPERD